VKHYKKFIIALLGAALIGLGVFFGIEIPYTPEGIYSVLVALLTAFGVEKVRNS